MSTNNRPAMWKELENSLTREFVFLDFQEAFSFMTAVAFVAEAQAHHPDWCNVYNRVTIRLNTHDAGGIITEKDHQLANAINKIAERYQH
ncbi:MAG: 4a-hydroxytetrahydrobiopterin dehydratase [Saprospiraceae bacterium]